MRTESRAHDRLSYLFIALPMVLFLGLALLPGQIVFAALLAVLALVMVGTGLGVRRWLLYREAVRIERTRSQLLAGLAAW
ncbi:hypothetical protein [Gloeobacter kilaueensis]|uniref:Uncharacterized protein n=1 Tax=Gloeobacter kilaueensis (strain ATCC BAA-2537 / CCAP 1431/1 / ULC 316 / JS1) TaxID=1183438 RepID=U5QH60_GLOK1|nr:hypothetical protein [Gloeobacter kilaueensis]AGY58228.1 hypothetical protein GKIL_1982 [Gloeobacter kilaueensis JS1]